MCFKNFLWIGNLKILKLLILLIINSRVFSVMRFKYVMKIESTFKYIYIYNLYCHIGKIIKVGFEFLLQLLCT